MVTTLRNDDQHPFDFPTNITVIRASCGDLDGLEVPRERVRQAAANDEMFKDMLRDVPDDYRLCVRCGLATEYMTKLEFLLHVEKGTMTSMNIIDLSMAAFDPTICRPPYCVQ